MSAAGNQDSLFLWDGQASNSVLWDFEEHCSLEILRMTIFYVLLSSIISTSWEMVTKKTKTLKGFIIFPVEDLFELLWQSQTDSLAAGDWLGWVWKAQSCTSNESQFVKKFDYISDRTTHSPETFSKTAAQTVGLEFSWFILLLFCFISWNKGCFRKCWFYSLACFSSDSATLLTRGWITMCSAVYCTFLNMFASCSLTVGQN